MKQAIQGLLGCLGHGDKRDDTAELDSFFRTLRSLEFHPEHIIDVGANRGLWTRRWLRHFPRCSVTLVEPQDELRTYITDLIQKGHRIQWLNAGAGDQCRAMNFTISDRDDSSTFNLSPEEASELGFEQTEVQVLTLNEIVARSTSPIPDLVKIDAEGFDLRVMAGASELLGKTEIFLLEGAVCCEPFADNTVVNCLNRMKELGYVLFDITNLNRSMKHGSLWLCELAFIKEDSGLLKEARVYE